MKIFLIIMFLLLVVVFCVWGIGTIRILKWTGVKEQNRLMKRINKYFNKRINNKNRNEFNKLSKKLKDIELNRSDFLFCQLLISLEWLLYKKKKFYNEYMYFEGIIKTDKTSNKRKRFHKDDLINELNRRIDLYNEQLIGLGKAL